MAAQAWPYLVARGRDAGYRPLLVPGFMADAESSHLLEYASVPEPAAEDGVIVREILGGDVGKLTLVYRALLPDAEDFGIEGSGPLTDRAGRRFRVFEGFVLRTTARQVAGLPLSAADFLRLREAASSYYAEFWGAGESLPARRTEAMTVAASTQDSLPLHRVDPYQVPVPRTGALSAPRSLRTALVAACAALAAAAAAAAVLVTATDEQTTPPTQPPARVSPAETPGTKSPTRSKASVSPSGAPTGTKSPSPASVSPSGTRSTRSAR